MKSGVIKLIFSNNAEKSCTYFNTLGLLFLKFKFFIKVVLDSETVVDRVLDLVSSHFNLVEDVHSCDLAKEDISESIPCDFLMDLAFCSKVFHLYAYIKPASDPDLEKSVLYESSLEIADFNKLERGEFTETARGLSAVGSTEFSSHHGTLVSSMLHLIIKD